MAEAYRRLTAIVAIDVAGCSRLMAANYDGTLDARRCSMGQTVCNRRNNPTDAIIPASKTAPKTTGVAGSPLASLVHPANAGPSVDPTAAQV